MIMFYALFDQLKLEIWTAITLPLVTILLPLVYSFELAATTLDALDIESFLAVLLLSLGVSIVLVVEMFRILSDKVLSVLIKTKTSSTTNIDSALKPVTASSKVKYAGYQAVTSFLRFIRS